MNRYDLMLAVKDHPFEKREQFVSDHSSSRAATNRMRELAEYTHRQLGQKGFALFVVERDAVSRLKKTVVDQIWIDSSGVQSGGGVYAYHLVPGLIYDTVQHDAPPKSWKAGVKTVEDLDWVYNGQRFADRREAEQAAMDIYGRWTAVKHTTVSPDWDADVNVRWDFEAGKAVYLKPDPVLDAPSPSPAPEPAAPLPAVEQPLPAVEQALRDAGVVVESPEDPTEATRRVLVAKINGISDSREALEANFGKVWSTNELSQDFDVLGFMAPLVAVRRKSDGKKGSLCFQHSPRLYWGFQEV